MPLADFLAAVAAAPDDDTPRLVCADYLQETGRPERADLIRIQCELARLPSWDRRAKDLRHRQRILLARHGRGWLAELPVLDGVRWGRFARGFVAEVTVRDPDVLLTHAAAIRAAAPIEGVVFDAWVPPGGGRRVKPLPWLRRVGFGRADVSGDDVGRLLDSPLAEHARALDLSGLGVENPGAAAVARAGHLAGLEDLDLTNCFVGVAGVEALAGAKHLTNLRVLRFGSYGSGYVEDPFVTDEGVRAITRSPYLTTLTTLDLGNSQVTDAAVRGLLTAKTLANLESVNLGFAELGPAAFEVPDGPTRWRELNLKGSQIGDAGLAALARCPQLSGLVRLRLQNCNVGGAGVAALAGSPLAGELRDLDLADNDVAAEGAYHLARADWPHLHTLDLGGNGLGPEGAKHLAEAAGLSALVELKLRDNKVTDAGAAALAGAGWAAGLRRLDVAANDLGPAAAAALPGPHLRGLTELLLGKNPLGPDGVAALVRADWPALTDLDLAGTNARDGGAAALAGADVFGRLIRLKLDSCDIGGAGVAALAAAPASDLGELDLSFNAGFGDGGARALVGAAWPALRSLGLGACKIAQDGMRALADSPLFRQLRRFRSYGNQLPTTADFRALQYADLGPDWVAEDPPEPADEW